MEAVPKWSHVMSVTWLRTVQVRSTVRVSARVWFHSDSRYSYLQSTVTYARSLVSSQWGTSGNHKFHPRVRNWRELDYRELPWGAKPPRTGGQEHKHSRYLPTSTYIWKIDPSCSNLDLSLGYDFPWFAHHNFAVRLRDKVKEWFYCNWTLQGCPECLQADLLERHSN